jgi:hypothetical protein
MVVDAPEHDLPDPALAQGEEHRRELRRHRLRGR